jgi:hypothetical protein
MIFFGPVRSYDLIRLAQVGEPVPGEHALAGDDQAFAERRYGLEDCLRSGGAGLFADDVAASVENAQRNGSGMEIDAAVGSVGLVVIAHHGLP